MDEFEKWIKSELGNSTSRPEGVLSADIRIVASHVVNALKDQKHWPSSASRQFKSGYINQYSALLNVLNRFIDDEAVIDSLGLLFSSE